MRLALLGVLLVLVIGSGARAETYRCQGPDGKTLFTSDRSQCPGAQRHESSGRIQHAGGGAEAPAPPREAAGRAAGPLDEAAEAQAWRTKRTNAEAALAEATAQLGTLHEVASWCHRGGEVFATDRDGLRHDVDCGEIAVEEQALRREQKRLAGYLAEGLEEECRRAGCLPGWIR